MIHTVQHSLLFHMETRPSWQRNKTWHNEAHDSVAETLMREKYLDTAADTGLHQRPRINSSVE